MTKELIILFLPLLFEIKAEGYGTNWDVVQTQYLIYFLITQIPITQSSVSILMFFRGP